MSWFDCAVHRPIQNNMGGSLGPNLGLVLHHAVMNGSLYNFFNNPANQVSAHFWVAKDGTIEQYVDTDRVAWHGKQLNTRYVGVETEGCLASSNYAEPMTDAMVNSLAKIYAEGNRRYAWPFTLASQDGQPGFGYHRMAVNTACPCDVRLNRRSDILAIAQGAPPQPPPVVTFPKGEIKSMEVIQQGNTEYLVSNVVANGHLVQVKQELSSIGGSSNGSNTWVIDLTAAWPNQLGDVTDA